MRLVLREIAEGAWLQVLGDVGYRSSSVVM